MKIKIFEMVNDTYIYISIKIQTSAVQEAIIVGIWYAHCLMKPGYNNICYGNEQ